MELWLGWDISDHDERLLKQCASNLHNYSNHILNSWNYNNVTWILPEAKKLELQNSSSKHYPTTITSVDFS